VIWQVARKDTREESNKGLYFVCGAEYTNLLRCRGLRFVNVMLG
jgi:hypothetical protein